MLKDMGRKKQDKRIKCPNGNCKAKLSLKKLIEDGSLVKTSKGSLITCPECGREFYDK